MPEREGVAPARAASTLRGRRVLVTGGGFIGSRLVEVLVRDCAADVVVLVRRPESAERFAALECDVAVGDVTDRGRVTDVVAGCDTVFHCAYGTSGSQRHRRFVNREGTRRVLAAAGAAGVRRAVHVSTYLVYGRTPDGDLTEDAPRTRYGDHYADSKLDAERIALDLARTGHAPVVVLQPTNVYGPGAGVWGEDVLRKLRTGLVPLIDGGRGTCNAVYVDDVITAMLLAATADDVVGEAFLVSSGEDLTWAQFFRAFEDILGCGRRTVARTAAEASADWERHQAAQPRLDRELRTALRTRRMQPDALLATREARALRRLAAEVLPERLQERIKGERARTESPPTPDAADGTGAVHLLSPEEIAFYSARTRARIDKAGRLLGFRPQVDLVTGMGRTAQWVQQPNPAG